MADAKITGLTEMTTTATGDLLAIVDDPSGTALTQKITVNNLFKLPAGTTSLSPLKFTSGTNLTTAEAGAKEYDGKVFYGSHVASARGVDITEQFITLTSAYTIPGEGPALRAVFNFPSNGAVTLASNTTYFFQCVGSVSSLSATSGTFSLGFAGTASTTEIRYTGVASKTATTAATAQIVNVTSTSSTVVTSATTTTTGQWNIHGKVVVDTGGTFIPSIAHSVIANPIVGDNCFFRIWPVGNSTVQSVGNWS
jgi:hypothetical protein